MSAGSLWTLVKTPSNMQLTVSIDLTNRSSACLTDWGAPTIHRNIAKASTDDIFYDDFKP